MFDAFQLARCSASILIGVFSFFPSQADLRTGPGAPRWERPIIWVHDEVLLEVPEADAEKAAALLQKAMIEAFLETFPRCADGGARRSDDYAPPFAGPQPRGTRRVKGTKASRLGISFT